ncbi:MAG: M14 family zinc carboxypeptidase [Ardenticatenales bacterium]
MRRPLPRRFLRLAVPANAALLFALAAALGAGPPATRSAPRAPRPLGEYLEGDAPWSELAPDALPTANVDRAVEAAAADELPGPKGYALGFDHYGTPEQINTFLRQLEADYPDLVEVFEIGRSWQGRPILAARVTNERAAQRVDDRPAMYTDGQHHARELVSAAVPLHTLWTLVAGYGVDPTLTYLVDTRAAYFVPSVNVDGNAIALVDNQTWRKTANPTCCDDDGDGKVDEDAPVGFGYGTFGVDRWMFDDAWAEAHPDNPFVDGWQQHLAGRPQFDLGHFTGAFGGHVRTLPRVDADGDGFVEEDPIGGTDPNRNYDVLWDRGEPRVDAETYRGPSVWSEPETRTVRDFVERIGHLAMAVSYHSGTDLLLHPWGFSGSEPLPDASAYELMGAKGSELTEVNGYHGSPHVWTARGLYSAFGSTMDWLYKTRGAYAFSPETYGSDDTVFVERIGATGAFTVASSIGVGFNPNPDRILPAVDRWTRFATYLLASTPNIELNDARVDGSDLVLTIGNDGWLPADVVATVRAGDGMTMTLQPSPVRLAASQHAFRVPLAAIGRASIVLSARSISAIGTVPHEIERARWTLGVGIEGEVLVVDGAVVPFRDLGLAFGGWWADERFHGQEYACRGGAPDCPPPLAFTPPPPPTAGPTQTPAAPSTPAWPSPAPRPTRTPWSADAPPWWPRESATPRATATAPTATPSPSPSGTATGERDGAIYLPALRDDG